MVVKTYSINRSMMLKNKYLLFVIGLSTGISLMGQAQTIIGMGTDTPNPNAVLELVPENSNQGFLAPRLTSAQRTAPAFTGKLTSADNGLLVFDTNQGQFFYWYQGEWRRGVSGGDSGSNLPGRGTTWYAGTTAPGDIDAQEGDFYINESTGDIYRLSNSTFQLLGSLGKTAPTTLPHRNIYVGDNNNQPQPVTIQGDITIANDGTVTIQNAVITTTKLQDGAVTIPKIADDAVTRDKIAADVAGTGLSQASNGSLQVNVGDGLILDGDTIKAANIGGNGNDRVGTWYSGPNEPASANLGNARNGDYYYSTNQNIAYRRVGGNWQEVGGFTNTNDIQLNGNNYSYRTPWVYSGDVKPDDDANGANDVGKLGDFFYSTSEEKMYTKVYDKDTDKYPTGKWKGIS